MAINANTAGQLSDWFTKATGGANATAAPQAPSPTGTAFGGAATAKAPSAAVNNNVASWYSQITGRKADQAGVDFWTKQIASGSDPSEVYKGFVNSAIDNGDFDPNANKPVLLDLDSLKNRSVTTGQTVAGQLGGLLDANSNYIQSARDRAQRASNARGLSNSSIAASAGEDSAYQAALPIATSDAQVNRDVDSYNAALYNQGLMYNTDAQNAMISKDRDFVNQGNLQAAQFAADKATQAAALGSQMSIAQLQAETSKYQSDKNAATSQYNTDATAKNQAEQNKTTLVNNIIQSAELSPDRKAELLKQLGETGLASAIYVASDIAKDLQIPPSANPGGDGGG